MSSSYAKYRHSKYLQLKKFSDYVFIILLYNIYIYIFIIIYLTIANAETVKMFCEDKCSIFSTFTSGPI